MAPGWFGPKEVGRGLRPLTWQGWAVSAVFLVVLVGAALLGPKGLLAAVVVTGAYLGVIAVTRSRD